jgi:indole-3-glycerol phosphate synthase/phosphoribosylanthranilate isomerase
MDNILDTIIAHKRNEVNTLYEQYDLETLRTQALSARMPVAQPLFYQALEQARAHKQSFFITEFKRKSPSEGWINEHADLPAQIQYYVEAGASAISVLTDTTFFGGTYADLLQARMVRDRMEETGYPEVLLLQKDFILNPIQIYLAALHGADLILLIAAILPPEQLENLRKTAEDLGLGVLVEVHSAEELEPIAHLDFPVLGVNNRDLKTFRTALNRVNALAKHAKDRFLIAESGIHTDKEFQMVRGADGFLIGTGLMRTAGPDLATRFCTDGRLLFKACGIRSAVQLSFARADYLGINFSPLSKRSFPDLTPEMLQNTTLGEPVAVFYRNKMAEILAVLNRFPFKIVQVYAEDVQPEFIRSLKQKVFLAASIQSAADLERLEAFAGDVDLFILDGPQPGSGQSLDFDLLDHFPYPFLLAGGMHIDNLDQVKAYKNCIGVDIASGIESNGQPDANKITSISTQLKVLSSKTVV